MIRSVKQYSAANAVMRAMKSDLLTGADFQRLARTNSVRGVWDELRHTAYGQWLPDILPNDALSSEKIIRQLSALRFRRLLKTLTGKPLAVGEILLTRWELDTLESILRLWHGKDPSLDEVLSCTDLLHPLPVRSILESKTIEEVADALRGTPYMTPILESAQDYESKQTIFWVELALEKDYYRRLLAAVDALGGNDTRAGRRVLAFEIDMLNLTWLMRAIQYSHVNIEELKRLVVPGPGAISSRLVGTTITRERLDDLLADHLERTGNGRELHAVVPLERMAILEAIVAEMAVELATSLLTGYPFRITCILSFYLLLRMEIRNLYAVFAGKSAGMPEQDILSALRGLR